jgi:hypothetical protein
MRMGSMHRAASSVGRSSLLAFTNADEMAPVGGAADPSERDTERTGQSPFSRIPEPVGRDNSSVVGRLFR